MKNRIEYILFTGFEKLFSLLGLQLSRKFALVLAFIFFYIIPIRKKTVLDNLKHAFPSYDEKKIREIAFASYNNFAIALIEILCMPQMTIDEIKQAVNCSNIEFVREKYMEGNGLILLSAHFGNWEYLAASIGMQLNIPLSVVVKAQRNPYVNNWMNRIRTKWNNKVVPLGISIRQVYQTLKEKKIVAMVADQRGPEEGIKIYFFGRKVSTHTGPAVLSLKTGAPILYAIPVRQKDNSYKSEFAEISKENLSGTEDEKIKLLSQRHMSYLEGFIREYPEQWLWMHKRWKH